MMRILRWFTIVAFTLVGGKLSAGPTNEPAAGFLCFTNLPSGTHAMFWFTNYSKADLAIVPFVIEQQQTNGIWVTNSLLTRTNYSLAVWRKSLKGVAEEVSPGKGFIFLAPLLTNNQPWRLGLNCVGRAPLIDPVRDVVRHVTATNAAMSSSKVFSGTRYLVKTPEVRSP